MAQRSCLYCNKRLQPFYHTEWENTGVWHRPKSECDFCGETNWKINAGDPSLFDCQTEGCEGGTHSYKQKRRVKSRDPIWEKPGYNGDGLFCTLRCGYNYAKRALLGR